MALGTLCSQQARISTIVIQAPYLDAEMAGVLTEHELGRYLGERRSLGALSRPFSYLRASVMKEGNCKPAILKVGREQWRKVLGQVVMPFFTHSTQLVSPCVLEDRERMVGMHMGGPKLSAQEREALVSASPLESSWMQHLGCVKVAAKTAYLMEHLLTGCVLPATRAKGFLGDMAVGKPFESSKGSRLYLVSFDIEAEVVRVARRDEDGDREGVWEEAGDVGLHRVHLMRLPNLVHYVSKGYHRIGASPFVEPPWALDRVLVHFCESRNGACCSHWHMGLGTKQYNKLRAVDARKHKGKHKTTTIRPTRSKAHLGLPAP